MAERVRETLDLPDCEVVLLIGLPTSSTGLRQWRWLSEMESCFAQAKLKTLFTK